ncbi:LuxR C-terminal-related transcriptional regulator [Solimonas sp. K1W22B-7]|uniref:LuxR C-terminal-related transcriptional regulator n=1 Tax=Solimonas sp. K1W22B-7 TaxID=2303331 RepID=UPI0013C41601|nr:LuxR C-terminal-related transcriptional regulator [Solimonas sp. K1W22B-7]
MTSPGDLPLIRTKLAPPRVGSAPVSRDTLLRQLDDGRGRKLTLVVGPAGSGKTMLLAQWRRKLFLQGAKVAWYNAGTDDNEAQAAHYIVESLVQAGVAIDKEALHVYLRSGSRAWRPLVASLIDDIQSHDGDIYMIVDDLHHISSFGTLKLFDRWLSMAPERCHLVLSSRTRPPLQTARLRAEDELTELQFPELKFSREETHLFLQAQGLKELSAAQENMLHEMTDGWAAGLQLLAFSLRKEKNPDQFFEREGKLSLARADALEQYLETAVVQHLTEAEFSFLVQISACRRFNRELCELLTGDPQAAKHLARFENENLFLIPIDTDDAEPWYRFHRLFAGFLNTRLQAMGEVEVRKIHHLASRWFAGKNLHVEAMRHATLAGDADFVVQLIDRAARRMISGANFVELLKWCDAVPPESLRSRLNVCLCAAWAQLCCSRLEDFERNMAGIAQHPDRSRPEVAMEVQLLRAFHFNRQDDTAACLAILEPLMRGSPPANTFNSFMLYQLTSMSLLYSSDFERARELARLRHQLDIRERPEYPRPLIDVVNGISHLLQGNIRLATDSLQAFIEHALERTSFGVDAAGLYSGYLLEGFYQSGMLRQAQDFLDRYLDLVDAVGSTDGILFAYLVRARLQRLAGDYKAAHDTLVRLEESGYQRRLDRVIAWSLAEQVTLALSTAQNAPIRDLLGQLDRLAARYQDARNCAWSEIGLAALMAHATVAFANEKGTACLAAIEAAEEAARLNRRLLLTTRLGLMRAIALLRASRGAEGLKLGRQMIDIAAEAGMMRVLPDLGAAALLLAEPLLLGGIEGAARQLLEAAMAELKPARPDRSALEAAAEPDRASPPSVRRPTGLLSGREGEILGLLAQGLSIKSIARAMDVSPGTVKWHIKNLYAKLNALSREDALAKARKLRILS